MNQIDTDELMGRLTKNQAIAARALAEPTRDQRLEVHMLAAIARCDAALAAFAQTRIGQHVIDGLLDVRLRLTTGLELNPEEGL